MSNGAAAAAAIAKAIKASGVVLRLSPEDFRAVLARSREPLVVCGRGGLFYRNYTYMVSYKGLAFYTKSPDPITLPAAAETVTVRRIWVPG